VRSVPTLARVIEALVKHKNFLKLNNGNEYFKNCQRMYKILKTLKIHMGIVH